MEGAVIKIQGGKVSDYFQRPSCDRKGVEPPLMAVLWQNLRWFLWARRIFRNIPADGLCTDGK
jgi:hypothetical protein